MSNSTISPLIDFTRQTIASQRLMLDNMEQLLNAWPLDVQAVGAGGARGAAIPSKTRARGRTRAGGGRGPAKTPALGTAR